MERNKVDYSGRTVDLLLLKTVFSVPAVNKRVDMDVSGRPMIVTGAEKMAQRYIILFLNAIGSTKFRPDHGTELVKSVSDGLVYNMATLETAASGANLEALRQMTISDAENEDTPDDERIVSSEVTDLEFSREKSRVKISVKMTTAAGNSYVYVVPVDVGVH